MRECHKLPSTLYVKPILKISPRDKNDENGIADFLSSDVMTDRDLHIPAEFNQNPSHVGDGTC
jgi:hypothetical protein